jgi:hypothetical protein
MLGSGSDRAHLGAAIDGRKGTWQDSAARVARHLTSGV